MRAVVAAVLLAAVACSNAKVTPAAALPDSILLESQAFGPGMRIPDAYACKPTGKNISPPLRWQEVPEGVSELVLVMHDADARGYVHWLVYGIPPNVDRFDLGRTPAGAEEGTNDAGRVGYRGPCPPRGTLHEYAFTLYALRSSLGFERGATKDDVLGALNGRAIARGTLTGVYGRQ